MINAISITTSNRYPGGGDVPVILAENYIAARGITDPNHQAYLYAFNEELINGGLVNTDGTSTYIKALYLYGGTQATAAGHKWNFMNPVDTDAAFRETYFGGLTQNSNGITGNAIDAYIDPHFSHSDFAGQDDCHIMTYIRDNQSPSGLQAAYGAIASSFNGTRVFPKYNGTTMYNSLFGSTGGGVPNTDSSGLWITTRTGSGNQPIYRNGSSFGLIGSSSSSVPTASIKGLCVDYNNSQIIYQYSSYNICARSYGNGLSSNESAAYSSALNNYFTLLGLNIY